MTVIYPVIMAGGTGTRLWPLSRRATPKQFQPLLTDRTMLAETVARLEGLPGIELRDPMVICGAAHADLARKSFENLHLNLGQLVLEPMGRNTAPCAVIAAALVAEKEPDALVLLLPADHHIAEPKSFMQAIGHAASAASQGYLTTFGIAPDRPETGYGYIRHGEALNDEAYTVDCFVEKPDLETAKRYLAEGGYSWNAGIFLFPAGLFLDEAKLHASDIASASLSALDASERDGDMVALNKDAFAKVPSDSIDYAIMERTQRAAVIGPVSMGWNDIGSWHAVRAMSEGHDGTHPGKVMVKDCTNTMVKSDGPAVAAIGLDNVVIVATDDAILVVDADRAQDVKSIIDELKSHGRDDLL